MNLCRSLARSLATCREPLERGRLYAREIAPCLQVFFLSEVYCMALTSSLSPVVLSAGQLAWGWGVGKEYGQWLSPFLKPVHGPLLFAHRQPHPLHPGPQAFWRPSSSPCTPSSPCPSLSTACQLASCPRSAHLWFTTAPLPEECRVTVHILRSCWFTYRIKSLCSSWNFSFLICFSLSFLKAECCLVVVSLIWLESVWWGN